jgi:hypothetical protein
MSLKLSCEKELYTTHVHFATVVAIVVLWNMGCVSYDQRTYLVILRKRFCFMYKHLQRGSCVLLISRDEEIKHAGNRLLIRILDEKDVRSRVWAVHKRVCVTIPVCQ